MYHQDIEMITSETPYKCAEIIRDTWPGIYRNPKKLYDEKKTKTYERILDCNRE